MAMVGIQSITKLRGAEIEPKVTKRWGKTKGQMTDSNIFDTGDISIRSM